MNSNKFYITTPIYYANAKPHLGTLYSTLLADCAARFAKLQGKQVFFLTGTDEHGQKLQEAAIKANMEPQAFVDSMIEPFKQVWNLYDVQYHRFIRTTDADHKQAVKILIERMQANGDIYKSQYHGLYCVSCETFMTPDIAFCPMHVDKPLKEVSEDSYFFKLSAYQDKLLAFYEAHPDFVHPKERLNEVISFVNGGLKDLSISRKSVSWGIPFPGDSEHTVYVWGDALTNYITAVGFGQEGSKAAEQFKFWWPADVHVMAKDIVRFHAIYWPAFLMSLGLELPKKLLVHGYILMGDQKMSKSLGNAIDPQSLATEYGVDQIRYYLLRHMAITHDGIFDIKDLENRIIADLANSLGNLLNRTLTLALNNDFGTVPVLKNRTAAVLQAQELLCLKTYHEEMNLGNFHLALNAVWKYIAEVNAYFHEQEPWKLVKNNREAFEVAMSSACQSLHTIATMLWPVMPKKMETLLAALGVSIHEMSSWKGAYQLMLTQEPLFIRPEPKNVEDKTQVTAAEQPKELKPEIPVIMIDDFVKPHLVIGTVLQAEAVAGSTKLLKLQVDLGSYGMRQVLSGVAMHFKPEDLVGKQGVYVANLAPRKMMGFESHGMMLFAGDTQGSFQMVTVGAAVENGTRVS